MRERLEFVTENHGEDATWPAVIGAGRCRIFFNDFQVYRFEFFDIREALTRSVMVLDKLRHFPVAARLAQAHRRATGSSAGVVPRAARKGARIQRRNRASSPRARR